MEELVQDSSVSRRWPAIMERLLSLGVSPTQRVPAEQFGRELLAAATQLLGAEQALIFNFNEHTFEFVAVAGCQISPERLAAASFRSSEGAIGRAAIGTDVVVSEGIHWNGSADLTTPGLAIPLTVQGRPAGLLWVAQPPSGPFVPEQLAIARRLRHLAGLLLANQKYFENWQNAREELSAVLSAALRASGVRSPSDDHRERTWMTAFAQEVHLPAPLLRETIWGLLLRDIGMIGVDEAIRRKPAKLSDVEYATVRRHPMIGYDMLSAAPDMRGAAAIVRTHQEWFNGKGYPDGLAEEEISLPARLVSIVDAWSAMASVRPYRAALTTSAAMTELRRQSGTQFDPHLVDAFLRMLEKLSAPIAHV